MDRIKGYVTSRWTTYHQGLQFLHWHKPLNNFSLFSSLRKKPTSSDAILVSPPNDVWGTSAEVPYWGYITTHIWVVLLIGRSCRRKIALTYQKRNPDLGCDKSAVWNFCSRFLDVISRRNQWWHREMSTVFSGSLFSYPANFWYNGINSISTGRRILAFSTISVKSGSSSEFPNNELRATWVFPNTACRTQRLNSPGSW